MHIILVLLPYKPTVWLGFFISSLVRSVLIKNVDCPSSFWMGPGALCHAMSGRERFQPPVFARHVVVRERETDAESHVYIRRRVQVHGTMTLSTFGNEELGGGGVWTVTNLRVAAASGGDG
jgi:hypothetical protein